MRPAGVLFLAGVGTLKSKRLPDAIEGNLMKSPFPGMDPYIEACGLWEDFHHALIEEIKNTLNQAVSDRYLVRTAERGYVVLADDSGSEHHHPCKPDVTVTSTQEESSVAGAAIVVAEAV